MVSALRSRSRLDLCPQERKEGRKERRDGGREGRKKRERE